MGYPGTRRSLSWRDSAQGFMMGTPLANMILRGQHRPAYRDYIPGQHGGGYNPLSAEHLQISSIGKKLIAIPSIDANNISSLFIDQLDSYPSDSAEFLVNHVPILSPPFPEFWVEASYPWMTVSSPDGSKIGRGGRFGMYFRAVDAWAGECTQTEAGERWILEGALYLGMDEVIGPLLTTAAFVADDGHPLFYKCAIHPTRNSDKQSTMITMVMPMWLAISFMHCKNVALREERAPEKLRKANAKRGRQSMVKWNVLEIEPMKQVLRGEGKSESVGLRQALHICRGHFKDYRQSGLFGKVKGIFWWDSTVRGSSKQGVVVKDYSIKAPQ